MEETKSTSEHQRMARHSDKPPLRASEVTKSAQFTDDNGQNHDGCSDNIPNIQSALTGGEATSEDDDISPDGKLNKNAEMFYEAQDHEHDQDDIDDDDDDDMIDDDIIDEETQLEMQKHEIDRANSLDSESASNASPLPNQKKIRSLRHAATLATDGTGTKENYAYDSEQKKQ